MTYPATKFEVATSNPLGGDTFTRKYKMLPRFRRFIYKKIQYLTFYLVLGVKVTRNVALYPLHHVTYSATKFEVDMSNRLGGDTFTRKYII